jgi:hypothetical protein
MLDGYHRVFNNFAVNTMQKRVDIPDAALGVGFAENLAPTPLTLFYESGNNQTAIYEKVSTSMDASSKGLDNQYTNKDFPSVGWFGDSYGAV